MTKFLALVLSLLIVFSLTAIFGRIDWADQAACLLVLALPVLAFAQLRVREAYLLIICVALTATAYWLGHDLAGLIWMGLSQSAYLASFILLVALLREAAVSSKSVVAIGHFLTRQPPHRRFTAIFSGAHALAVMINLGALSLLAPIIQKGIEAEQATGRSTKAAIDLMEKRQLTATLRGFCWFLVWAPTAVTQAVMPRAMNDISIPRLMAAGLCLAFIMYLISWWEDRWQHRHVAVESHEPSDLPILPHRALMRFGSVCILLFALTIGFSQLGGTSLISGVMLAAPIVVTAWLIIQKQSSALPAGRGREMLLVALPGYGREAVFIACAGFIGTMAGQLVPSDQWAQMLNLAAMPKWFVLLMLSVTVLIFGQLGLSPITLAIVLASVVAQISQLPVDQTQAALAIAAGTAICTVGAPFSSGAVLLSRVTGLDARTITWRWNGLYVFLCIIALGLFYYFWTLAGSVF